MILGFITIFLSFISSRVAKIPAYILNLILNLIIKIVKFLGNLKISKIYIVTPSIFQIILLYGMICIIFYIIKNKNKTICMIAKNKKILKITISITLIVYIIIRIFAATISSNLHIHFVDVGQGDCCLIITPKNKKILVDGGGSSADTYNVGKQILIPYLLDRKIKKIDYMMVSHFDSDHVLGLLTVMEELKVKKVIISKQGEDSENYRKFKKIVKKNKIKIIVVKSGDELIIENDLKFQVLWPGEDQIQENILNNNSIVCKLKYKNFSMLFTGDIEEIAEKQILKKYENNLQILNSNVLKVGHHGSKTSSTQEFIGEITPQLALIGVGKNNKFGHPNDDVIKRLEGLRNSNISYWSNGRDITKSR